MDETSTRDIVLVIDDSPETLGMLTETLDNAGLTVLVALEGPKALDLIEHVTPDIVLMDAVMPGMDGFETCRRMKRDRNMVHVPVIFMTGLSETEHIVRGLEAGGVDYVTKPIRLEELVARMRVHLSNARLANSARMALDVAGRFLLSVNSAAELLWCTPQSGQRLEKALGWRVNDRSTLPAEAVAWLAQSQGRATRIPSKPLPITSETTGQSMTLSYVAQIRPNEFLLRIVEQEGSSDEATLRLRLGLTAREADVLAWLARGKANRDIGEILGLSPRTVEKHLELVFAKLGVDNRTAAATVAVRALETS
ncbi:response regulator transcription factor [Telmatospirillum siberiense]|uniref:DNA-binding response regulator n=1 Tax=Telmatospirillum siberiense TaxID=382514 RepID=A0A2N3PZS4_9PROT|nr:response regulator transcription factor [Telmatospirillum siberiense]PKU25917.1 DNA-binding response regulator [Telmatospirillum siberiense]